MAVPQPRVESTTPEQEIEPQLIVQFLMELFVKSLIRLIPYYVSQDEEETPAQNTRSRKNIQHTITQEAILAGMESTYSSPTARQCSSPNFRRQMLCDLSNAVMDANGELLQYFHLMVRP